MISGGEDEELSSSCQNYSLHLIGQSRAAHATSTMQATALQASTFLAQRESERSLTRSLNSVTTPWVFSQDLGFFNSTLDLFLKTLVFFLLY